LVDPPKAAAAPVRVLLADDDDSFLEALRPLIEHQPYLTVVGIAENGLDAIELADDLAPDAVVIDLHMPLVDGVTAVSRLRQDHPHLCLIVLTGDDARWASIEKYVKTAFFGTNIGLDQLTGAYAGVRPLISTGDTRKSVDISRKAELYETSSGLITITGGKLTTWRRMAKLAVDRVVDHLDHVGIDRLEQNVRL